MIEYLNKYNEIFCNEGMPDMSFSDGDDENYLWNIEEDYDY